MMITMKIADLFKQIALNMSSNLNMTRIALSQPGLKGESFEEIFRKFLRDYLPKSLDISTGILIDSKGNQSRQLDVIISDTAKTPIFFSSGKIRVIPVECVYTIIEVKSYLNAQELTKVFINMKSVRNLVKTAFIKSVGPIISTLNLYGREWEIWPINYYVFAYDSINLMPLMGHIYNKHRTDELPEHSRIDTVCVLNKGVICNKLVNDFFSALPEPGSHLYVCETKQALLLFYTLTANFLFQTKLPSFKFLDYLGKMEF